MIENELRLGNYLLGYDNNYFTWDYGHYDLCSKGIDADELGMPIELTEEILLKCGFAEFYKSDFSVKLECIKNPIFEFVRRNHKDWNLRIKGETHKHIKYLHQLQNLYFSLTGKELEIEL